MPGTLIVFVALVALLGGTLTSEHFTQRMSFVMMLSGIAVYFFGRSILRKLVVPFLLLLLAIPIPQIIFNKIAFPLQIWASQVADWGIRAVGIATIRMGNVIELTPLGSTRAVGLEIVEACSGIRSLMTLVTLASYPRLFHVRTPRRSRPNMVRPDPRSGRSPHRVVNDRGGPDSFDNKRGEGNDDRHIDISVRPRCRIRALARTVRIICFFDRPGPADPRQPWIEADCEPVWRFEHPRDSDERLADSRFADLEPPNTGPVLADVGRRRVY